MHKLKLINDKYLQSPSLPIPHSNLIFMYNPTM